MNTAPFSVAIRLSAHSHKQAERLAMQASTMFAEAAIEITKREEPPPPPPPPPVVEAPTPPPPPPQPPIEISPGIFVSEGKTIAKDRNGDAVVRVEGVTAGGLSLQQIDPITLETIGRGYWCQLGAFLDHYEILAPLAPREPTQGGTEPAPDAPTESTAAEVSAADETNPAPVPNSDDAPADKPRKKRKH